MPNKVTAFEDFKLNRQLLNAVNEMGYSSPTSIQVKAIPSILAGHDVLGIAQTGTGKTAAYLLPLLFKIKYAQGMFPRALILAPGKELVLQIFENLERLSSYCGTRNCCLYGGVGPKEQLAQLEAGVDIVVSTPGRFLELYRKGGLVTKHLRYLVLDEADKMMDMGFAPQIRQILEKIPRKRQNLLFSATFPEKVADFANEFLEFPTKIEVTPQSTPAATVEHFYYQTPNLKTKINLISHLFEDASFSKVIVFTRTKDSANNLHNFLDRKLHEQVRVIHANKSQNSRINAFRDFREGDVRVLVTTDVSARGLDIPSVSHVINFDVPTVYEEYVHRIGRTGRAREVGTAISFATPAEELHLAEIEKVISEKIDQRTLPGEVEIAPTDKEELKAIEMEIDRFRRAKDPDFKGAFHEKKARPTFKKDTKRKSRRRKKRR